jgi:hypothetical protein
MNKIYLILGVMLLLPGCSLLKDSKAQDKDIVLSIPQIEEENKQLKETNKVIELLNNDQNISFKLVDTAGVDFTDEVCLESGYVYEKEYLPSVFVQLNKGEKIITKQRFSAPEQLSDPFSCFSIERIKDENILLVKKHSADGLSVSDTYFDWRLDKDIYQEIIKTFQISQLDRNSVIHGIEEQGRILFQIQQSEKISDLLDYSGTMVELRDELIEDLLLMTIIEETEELIDFQKNI